MPITIEPVGPERLADYASIPMVCDVRSSLTIDQGADSMSGLRLVERPVEAPYYKNYDASADGGPLSGPGDSICRPGDSGSVVPTM